MQRLRRSESESALGKTSKSQDSQQLRAPARGSSTESLSVRPTEGEAGDGGERQARRQRAEAQSRRARVSQFEGGWEWETGVGAWEGERSRDSQSRVFCFFCFINFF
uniref:Uncharacterized protein n=1 Tax=Opuntia streptacantha TaxID=393608 RepID=A0A7C9A430_OPUST